MKNKKYKAVVIGCGKIGVEKNNYKKDIQPVTHAGAFSSNPRTDFLAMVDINKKRLKIASRNFPGVLLFDSAEEMFKKIKPDIVSVATYPDSHPEFVKMAVCFKTKAIFCEKPIANSLREAKEMINICKKNKSFLFINHQRRFDNLLRKWQIKVKRGLIGDIVSGNSYYYNGLFNNGTHNIDFLRFFLGDVDWVRAVDNEKTSWKRGDNNVDALIGFKSGARIFLHSLPKNYGFISFYLYGTKGRIAIKNLGYEIEYRKLINNKYYKGFYQLDDKAKKEGKPRSFMKEAVNHIVFCLDNKVQPISRGEDGLAALEVLFSLRKSADSNGKIIKI